MDNPDTAQQNDTPDNAAITIDVISDVVCPWCFIGKRQLEQALTTLADKNPGQPAPEVRWHPFQLNPDMPAEGMSRADYLKAKFGDPTGGSAYDNVRAAAGSADLAINFDGIKRQPNTRLAHALIAMAQADAQQRLVEALFQAYFIDNLDLTLDETLIEVARGCGMPEPIIEAALNDASVLQAVEQADAQARQLGVSGVPFFIFNQQLAVSGAAGADTLIAAYEKVTAPQEGTQQQAQ